MAARILCFVCDRLGQVRQMPRMGNDPDKHQVAIFRRANNDLADALVTENTRMCFNCNQSIVNELETIRNDPACLRLNIIKQKQNRACIVCAAVEDVIRLSAESRSYVFIEANIYIPNGARCCRQHLDRNGFILLPLIPGLRFVNRPYVIPGADLQTFLENLRIAAKIEDRLFNQDKLSEEEFHCLFSLNKAQFEELLNYCDPVPEGRGIRNVHQKDLMTFLCKLRQGLSDEFLTIIFNYSSRQAVSMAISTVIRSLIMRFVPGNIGTAAITREDFIARHVTPFANELYNDQPQVPKAITVCDATYAYIHKSKNFRVLRQSYCFHKGAHLLKPTLIVAPDGYILFILGPYFSDAHNNDAEILRSEFERDAGNLRDWFQDGDIMLVDRGYRDVTELLTRLGIDHRMPALLERGRNQFTTEEANDTRMVTKVRWVVEARNGHIRTIFKLFKGVFNIQTARHIGDLYRIAGALINRYHPSINMQNATVEVARLMRERRNEANVVQARVEIDRLHMRHAQWVRLADQVPAFPRLDLEYLRDLTIGIYQINLAPSYIQDKLVRGNHEIEVDEHFEENNLIRLRMNSRYRNRLNYQVFISYVPTEEVNLEEELINGYYCTCPSGARTLGTCAHVASVLWYLGYARHDPNIQYPDESLLNTTRDAADRWQPEVIDDVDILEDANE